MQENISFALNYHLSVGDCCLNATRPKAERKGSPTGFFHSQIKMARFVPFFFKFKVKTLDVSLSMFRKAFSTLESETSEYFITL